MRHLFDLHWAGAGQEPHKQAPDVLTPSSVWLRARAEKQSTRRAITVKTEKELSGGGLAALGLRGSGRNVNIG